MELTYNKRRVMPLMGSSFTAGSATEVINRIADAGERDIAMAEHHYFSGEAEKCTALTERYLDSEDVSLRISADMLYAFANLTLGNAAAAQRGREDIKKCTDWALGTGADREIEAYCLFASYISMVLLHIQPEGLPDLGEYNRYLPTGLRLYAVYVLAHGAYLKGEYAKALGMAQSAFMLADREYPIAMIYLKCIIAMCQMNLKLQEEAKETIMSAWEMARRDGYLEPFIEHHGPMQGALESCIRKTEPQMYKKLVDQVIAFSRGWMKIHNPEAQKKVTALLTPMEFSIAMLACRDWTNQEIADYLDLSVNTVKHYVSGILEKLHVDKREKLKEYVNQ